MRVLTLILALSVPLACSSGADSPPGNAGGSGGAGAVGGSAGVGVGGSSGLGGGGSAGSTGGSAGSTGGSAGSTGGSAGSTGGAAGSGGAWPTCDAPPAGAPQKTIKQIWTDNPTQPTATWIGGVYVTAISGSACTASTTCQLFVQSAETFASFAAGAQQAIRVLVFPPAVTDFVPLAVGDQIDLYGPVWRHTSGGANELFVEIGSSYPGCAKKIGTGNPTGTPGVTLDDLTLAAYETTHGPLLVTLASVSGKPKKPNETFALFKSFQIEDGGIANVTSLSPFFLAGGMFTTLTEGSLVNFTSLTGVFGLFVPSGSTIKYEEIYIRSMGDAVVGST